MDRVGQAMTGMALVLVLACGGGSSGFSEFAKHVESPTPCKTAETCRVLRDRASAFIAECFQSGRAPCKRESEVYDRALRVYQTFDEQREPADKDEFKQSDPIKKELAVTITGDLVAATLTVQGRCRHGRSDWSPCSRPVSGVQLIGKLVGVSVTEMRTDSSGTATFDLRQMIRPSHGGKEENALANHAVNVWYPPINVFDSILPDTTVDVASAPALLDLRRDEYTSLVKQAEEAIANVENSLTAMERMPAPSTLPLAQRYRDLAQESLRSNEHVADVGKQAPRSLRALQEACQQSCKGESAACSRSSSAVTTCMNLDPTLGPRVNALVERAKKVQERSQALRPRTDRAAAVLRKQDEAIAMALLQAMGQGSSGGSSSSSSSPSSEREAAERHDRERAEDQRKHQQEREDDERRRKDNEARQHQQSVADCISRCQEQCYRDRIRKDCENIAPCQQQCPK